MSSTLPLCDLPSRTHLTPTKPAKDWSLINKNQRLRPQDVGSIDKLEKEDQHLIHWKYDLELLNSWFGEKITVVCLALLLSFWESFP